MLNNGDDVHASNDVGFKEPDVDLRQESHANADALCESESTDDVNKVEENSEDLTLHGKNISPSSGYFSSESEFTNPETLFIESGNLNHVHGEVKQKESDKMYVTQDGSNAIQHIKQYPDNLTPGNRVEKVETESLQMSSDNTTITNGECQSKFPEMTGGSPHALGESQGKEICADEADECSDVTREASSEKQEVSKTGESSDRTEEGPDETEGLGNLKNRLDEAGIGPSETEEEVETNFVKEDGPELASEHFREGEPGVIGEGPDVRGEEAAPCITEEGPCEVEGSSGEV